MYKAVIFDLDGTLLDTISDISDSVNAALIRYGHKIYSEAQYKYFVGKGIDVLIEKVITTGDIDPDEFAKLKQAYIEEYAKRNSVKTRPYEGISELLIDLHSQGVKICILSNKPHFQTEEVVKKYFGAVPFDVIFGKLPEYEIKPHPASAEKILEILGLRREDVLYVGDTNIDIETAKNAGLDSVGVLWGFRNEAELAAAGADYIVGEPKEILNIVERDAYDS